MTWYAFRVTSQRELTAHQFLTEKRGLEVLVPYEQTLGKPIREKGKKPKDNWIKRPLLVGYVLINTEDPHALVHRFGVLQSVVTFDDKPAPIYPYDIARLMELSGRIANRRDAPIKLKIGQTIRITTGAAQGLRGLITEAKGERVRVQLSKPVLGKETIEIKRSSLEAA